MSYWPTNEQESRIRIYIYQNRLKDAVDSYQASSGRTEEEAVSFIGLFAKDLRKSSGYALKVLFFRLLAAISLAVPYGLFFGLAGVVWALAFGKSGLQFGIWTSCSAGLFAAVLSPLIRSREAAFFLGMLLYGLGGLTIVLGIIVGLVRRLVFPG